MTTSLNIIWFRQDLRLADNPALIAAAKAGSVLPIYILDDVNAKKDAMGEASRWWLHHSLTALNKSLKGKLRVFKGDAAAIFEQLTDEYTVASVHWNRCYEPWRIKRDKKIKKSLLEKGIDAQSYKGSLLWEPWEIGKADGTHYKVFSPFYYRGCLAAQSAIGAPLDKPNKIQLDESVPETSVDDLDLLPKIAWDKKLIAHWQFGEKAALKVLERFVDNGITDYKDGRNFPAQENVSRLSPYLHFGEISTRQVWCRAQECGDGRNVAHFHSELGWREFAHSQLFYFPNLPRKNLQAKFDHFPWRKNAKHLRAWQKGKTGYPMVDAGMRELWQTGYMHNRVRMIVGSFLVKNLLLHWRDGEAWFWDCLVDADLANNSAGWQWIAGCGADAAPYFRVFNPVTQGEKFDGAGEYTRRFVPELAGLPDKYLYQPWAAPDEVLEEAGVKLGDNYPKPIVDVKASRERALDAFKALKAATENA